MRNMEAFRFFALWGRRVDKQNTLLATLLSGTGRMQPWCKARIPTGSAEELFSSIPFHKM